MDTKNKKIIIYTDGAARGNPGKAGWSAVIIFHDDELKVENKNLKVVEIGGHSKHATNNQMELTAVIGALKYVKELCVRQDLTQITQGSPVEIFSDSKYVILGITEWITGWQKKNWKTAGGKPVLNRELWEELNSLNNEIKPKWRYVEGHNGDEWNERADEIATNFADEQ